MLAAAVLPEVVITGSRQELLVDDLPMSADVVGEDDLHGKQRQNLGQALENLPNASIRSTPARLAVGAASSAFARDGNTGINIRGLGGNRVMMLLDGVRMPRSYVSRSAIFDREYLSLDLFKRMEITRGPASALYGSEGMAGVVNFVSYDPVDFLRQPGQAGLRQVGGRVSAGWSGDDEGYALAGTVAARAGDSAQWMLTAVRRNAHGLDTRGNIGAPDSTRTRPNPQHDRNTALLGKVVLEPHGRQRHVIGIEFMEKRSTVDLLSSVAPSPSVPNDILAEDSDYTGERQRLSWDARFDLDSAWADHVRTLVAWQDSRSRRVGNSHLFSGTHRIRDNRYSERAWQLGVQADKVWRHGDWSHRVVYGADWVRNSITNLYDGQAPLPPEVFPLKRFPDTRETTSALYIQDESVWGDWSFTPGVRIDHYSIDVTSQQGYYPPAQQPGRSSSGTAVSPKFGVLWRATPSWSLYGQYSAGYRPPEAGQLNDHFEALAPPNFHVLIQPNPNLRPERSRGFEVGLRGRMERLSLDLALFSNRYSNLIVDAELVQEIGTNRVFQAVNVGRARIHGFELKGRYDWGRVGDGRLSTTFAYGQTRGTDRSSGQPLNSIDPAQFALGLRYDAATWSLYADMRHHMAKKAKHIDSEAIMAARSGIQFAPPSASIIDVGLQWRPRRDIRVNLAVRNLGNKKYWLWPNVYGLAGSSPIKDAYSQPGRSAHVSVVFDF